MRAKRTLVIQDGECGRGILQRAAGRYPGKFPYIARKDSLEAPLAFVNATSKGFKFTATYGSLGDKKYRTEMILYRRDDTVELRKEWIFEQIE